MNNCRKCGKDLSDRNYDYLSIASQFGYCDKKCLIETEPDYTGFDWEAAGMILIGLLGTAAFVIFIYLLAINGAFH